MIGAALGFGVRAAAVFSRRELTARITATALDFAPRANHARDLRETVNWMSRELSFHRHSLEAVARLDASFRLLLARVTFWTTVLQIATARGIYVRAAAVGRVRNFAAGGTLFTLGLIRADRERFRGASLREELQCTQSPSLKFEPAASCLAARRGRRGLALILGLAGDNLISQYANVSGLAAVSGHGAIAAHPVINGAAGILILVQLATRELAGTFQSFAALGRRLRGNNVASEQDNEDGNTHLTPGALGVS